jgi:hypothetical protein
MKVIVTVLLAAGILGGAAQAGPSHPIEHTANAAGHAMRKGWHKAAHGAQVVAAHNSWSRRRRAYHLRKAAGHAAKARRAGHAAHAESKKAGM